MLKGFLITLVIQLIHLMVCQMMHVPAKAAIAGAVISVLALILITETGEVTP